MPSLLWNGEVSPWRGDTASPGHTASKGLRTGIQQQREAITQEEGWTRTGSSWILRVIQTQPLLEAEVSHGNLSGACAGIPDRAAQGSFH